MSEMSSNSVQNVNKTEIKSNQSTSQTTSGSTPIKEQQSVSGIQNQKNLSKKRRIGEKSERNDSNSRRDFQSSDKTWIRLTGAPAWDLPPNESQQTFTGRCRLFVANLPQNASEEQLRSLFGEFGQISDIYIGKGNQFAFVKMDTRVNAETAKQHLDGKQLENRTLRVRLAAHASAIRVTNLPPLVSNELLSLAFSSFGTVERAVVSADDRGRSLNEGIVEFARKSSSQAAIKKCQNECLLLSSTPIPVVVTPLESRDEEEGVPEKSVLHLPEYRSERELGPRFAERDTIELEMARKWKQLMEIEIQRRSEFESEFRDLRQQLSEQMEYLKIEETTKQLRQQLRQMEEQSQKLCAEREQRIEFERRREDQRRQTELILRQQEEQLLRRNQSSGGSSDDLQGLRRQENELRQQANALQQLLDRQEQALRQMTAQDVLNQPQLDLNSHSLAAFGAGVGVGVGVGGAPNQMTPPNQMAPPLSHHSNNNQYLNPNVNQNSIQIPIHSRNPNQNQYLVQNSIQNQQNPQQRQHSRPFSHQNFKRNRRF